MKNTKLSLAAIAALASAGVAAVADTGDRIVRAVAPRRARTTASARRRYHIRPSGTSYYPEQSARQAQRGQRRAQGGPGLFRMKDGTYVPRDQLNPV